MRTSILVPIRVTVLPMVGALMFLGCSEAPTAVPPPSEGHIAGNPVVASATGAGHFQNLLHRRTFSFSAVRRHDGSVYGQFQGFNRAFGNRLEGIVTCIGTRSGNIAYIGGIVKTATRPSRIGTDAIFTVVDHGEGASSPADQISFLFANLPTGFATAYCDDPFDLPGGLNDILNGNIQVNAQGGGRPRQRRQ